MISKFRMQSWFEMFFIRYNQELLLSSSFEKTQLYYLARVTTI